MQHEGRDGKEVQTSERGRESFVVPCQASEPCCPREGALDDPSSGEQDEAALGFGEFHDIQRNAVLGRGRGGGFARVALVYVGQADCLAGDRMDISRQGAD